MRGPVEAESGNAVVSDGTPVGRVASARRSPTLGHCIGLAWVPVELATGDRPLQIRVNGKLADADIVESAFYDPRGERVRA